MDANVILTSTLITAVLSTGISYLVGIQLKKRDYEYDYKKYILGKRKEAYDIIQKIIHGCLLKKTQHSQYSFCYFFLDVAHLKDFIQQIETVQTVWVSNEIYQIIKELLSICIKCNDMWREIEVAVATGYYDEPPEEYYEPFKKEAYQGIHDFGVKNHSEIDAVTTRLQKQYLTDLKSLDDIKKFKKMASYKTAIA
jgi:hypothetical protein